MLRRLYIFLEGNDDERFFANILFPLLNEKYPKIQAVPYAEETPKRTRKFVAAIRSSPDDYIFVRDINDSPCVTASKAKVSRKYQVDQDNLLIVVKEIECWYLCGLNCECCKKLGISRRIGNTDNMTKENFDDLLPTGISRIEFMQQIVEEYDVDVGKRKNQSLRYFLRKWVK